MASKDNTAEGILEYLGDPDNYPDEALTLYEEISVGANVYYFIRGGFLYRKEPETEKVGGSLGCYLTDGAGHYRTDDGVVGVSKSRKATTPLQGPRPMDAIRAKRRTREGDE